MVLAKAGGRHHEELNIKLCPPSPIPSRYGQFVKLTSCILCLSSLFIGCDFKTSESYRAEATTYETVGNYRAAIERLDKAILKDSQNIKALLDRAVDKSFLKDYHGAILDYSKVLQIDSKNPLAYLNRGKNNCRLQNYNEGIRDYNSAISSKGGETFYIDKLENRFVETGFEYDVKMEEIRFERGIAFYHIDSFQKASVDFWFSVNMNYVLPKSHYWLGLTYFKLRKNKLACDELNKATLLGDRDAKQIEQQYCR